MKRSKVRNTVYAALFLAIAYLLPYLAMNLKSLGTMLSPMHLPVFICGFVCGPLWGLAVGAVAPLLRSLIVGMPQFYPSAVAMCFELAAYGFFAGFFHRLFPKKMPYLYLSLALSMLCGRLVWGVVRFAMLLSGTEFSFGIFISSVFVATWPGIVLQFILIPPIVAALNHENYRN